MRAVYTTIFLLFSTYLASASMNEDCAITTSKPIAMTSARICTGQPPSPITLSYLQMQLSACGWFTSHFTDETQCHKTATEYANHILSLISTFETISSSPASTTPSLTATTTQYKSSKSNGLPNLAPANPVSFPIGTTLDRSFDPKRIASLSQHTPQPQQPPQYPEPSITITFQQLYQIRDIILAFLLLSACTYIAIMKWQTRRQPLQPRVTKPIEPTFSPERTPAASFAVDEPLIETALPSVQNHPAPAIYIPPTPINRDPIAAARAMKIAKSYLDEIDKIDISDPQNAKEARNTLSLASQQLNAARSADPDAEAEIDEIPYTQAELRGTLLMHEARSWQHSNLSKSISIAEMATQADPSNPFLFRLLGIYLMEARKPAQAMTALTAAINLDPDDIETLKLLDRAKNISGLEVFTHHTTDAAAAVANVGIGTYSFFIHVYNAIALTHRIITFPMRMILKLFQIF